MLRLCPRVIICAICTVSAKYHPDFRRIPLGDIDLQHEIWMGDSSVVRSRRLHSAKIYRRKSSVTVAMYQGSGAEEVCCVTFLRIWRKYASGLAERYCEIYGYAASSSFNHIHIRIY
jgi:hypothetical protein